MFSAEKLSRYADVIVRQGLAVQPGQVVNVAGEVVHIELIRAIVAACYKARALQVSYELIDPFCEREHIVSASNEGLDFVPRHFSERSNQIVEQAGCSVRIVGLDDEHFWKRVDSARISRVNKHKREARKLLYEKGINQGAVQWCVAAGATPGWAQRLYPQLSPEAALERLWEQLYSLVRADQEDPLTAWKLHAEKLKRRCEWLNNLNISELHFQGPGTDLRVGLSWQARFTGGTHKSSSGTEFTPNVPTEEVFTTPDWHLTTGVVRATRPVLIYGKPVEGLVCEFQKGRLVNFSANVGADSFAALIDTDEGARQLGEVALVGIDSPVFQSGMVFNEILLDENAACHIAVGSAYRNCLQGSTDMSEENLKEVGCNESKIHVDLMISDEETNVTAVTRQQGPVPLIRSGLFVEA